MLTLPWRGILPPPPFKVIVMTGEELQEVMEPLFTGLHDKLDVLSTKMDDISEAVQHMTQVQYGMLIALGVVAGLILIHYLLDKFR